MGLIEVAEVQRQGSEVEVLPGRQAASRVVEALSLDDPFRAHSDVFVEQPL